MPSYDQIIKLSVTMDQSQSTKRASSITYDGPKETPTYAWVILAVIYIASVAAPLSQSKIPPVMPVLMEAFNLSLASTGLLMSVFAITGFLLALPAGLILQRVGLKVTGLIATGCLVIGSVLGALAATSGMLLFSRVVEGVGMGLIAVAAPAAIAMWFPPHKQGTPMGIWATWAPLGSTLMFVLAPWMADTYGWQSIWWFSAAFALLAFMLALVFLRMPSGMPTASLDTNKAAGEKLLDLKLALANRDIWFLAALFGLFNLALTAVSTYLPTFLTTLRGYTMSSAAFTASLPMIVVMLFAPLSGILSDKIGSRKALFTWPLLAIAVLLPLPFQVSSTLIPFFMILNGMIVGAVPTAAFSAAPEIMRKPELAGLGLGVISLGQSLGMFIGPILFGGLVEQVNWTAASLAMFPFMLAAFFFGRAVQVR